MAITADFSATTSREGYTPLTVSFQDQTTGATPVFRRWVFGDGTFVENETNPSHTYTKEGLYHVVLYVRDALNNDDTKIKTQYIIANKSHVLSENIIIQSQESGTPDKFWKFYIDSNLHLAFQYGDKLYKSKNPVISLDKWILVEFHLGSNALYSATASIARKMLDTEVINLGSIPSVNENRTFVLLNSSMEIDELKIWNKEVNLTSYYRSLKAKAYLLDSAE